MASNDEESRASKAAVRTGGTEPKFGGSIFLRRAARQTGFIAASLLAGFVLGLAYRFLLDPAEERTLGNFLRSGVHAAGIALTVWAVQTGFESGAQSRLGAALRQLPLAAEVVVRALVMTAALVVVGLSLQALLYAEPYHLNWLTRQWLTVTLPRIILLGFGMSLVIGIVVETRRLIGGALLTSVLLGTYHRPARRRLIVMFLDLANSTRLAEAMGELRVHDLITRFFFDIDEPISDYGGAVHAYVGDEVIATWPVTDDRERNAQCVACFFAIRRKMLALASRYEAEFGVAPSFRAGIHAGAVVVSECGDAKRQLAYFGDTMNVGARLCDYCKTINQQLVISGDLLSLMRLPDDLTVGEGKSVEVRGRQGCIEAYAVGAPLPASALRMRVAGPQECPSPSS
jgi:class 3 adenylate cyclase